MQVGRCAEPDPDGPLGPGNSVGLHLHQLLGEGRLGRAPETRPARARVVKQSKHGPHAGADHSVYVLTMAIQGKGYELVGVSLSGGPLTEPVHVELDNGMTALYGENGVGKTWLLRLMSSALTGVALGVAEGETAPLADLHLHLHDPHMLPTGPFLEGLAANLGSSVTARRGEFLQTDLDDDVLSMDRDEIGERRLFPDVWSRIALLIDLSPATHMASIEMGPTLYESADEGLVTLRACGSAQRPAWDVFLSGSVKHGETFPDLLLEISEAWFLLQQVHEAANSAEVVGMEKWRFVVEHWSTMNPLAWADTAPYFPFPPVGHTISARRARHEGWPDWLQVPILPLGETLAVSPVQVLGSEERPQDPDTDTLFHILDARPVTKDPDGRMTVPAAIVDNDADGPVFGDEVAEALERVQREAAANLHDVLPGAPTLRFHMGSIEEWLRGVRPIWQFLELGTGEWLPITMLSSAQERWARLAIGLASAPGYGLPVVFVCDEPEAGLHRLAERRLSTGLQDLALRTGVSVLAATHSPFLLDANHVRPVLVRRDFQGAVATSTIPLSVLNRLEAERSAGQLGMSVGDLLPLMRLAVVVEGLHDETVFTWLLREPLNSALATILPLHGGRHAPSLPDARLLFDGTDAQVLLVLDNLKHQEVNEIWTRTTTLAATGDFEGARACLDGLKHSKSSELLYLHQLGLRALDAGRMDRIHVHGLSLPDVICYLPPELLLTEAKPWSKLIGSWQRDSASKPPTNLKQWLKTNHYLPSDPEQIDAAVLSATVKAYRDGLPVHSDLVELGLHFQNLGSVSALPPRAPD